MINVNTVGVTNFEEGKEQISTKEPNAHDSTIIVLRWTGLFKFSMIIVGFKLEFFLQNLLSSLFCHCYSPFAMYGAVSDGVEAGVLLRSNFEIGSRVLEVDKVADLVADMKVDMVANMVVDGVANMLLHMVTSGENLFKSSCRGITIN